MSFRNFSLRCAVAVLSLISCVAVSAQNAPAYSYPTPLALTSSWNLSLLSAFNQSLRTYPITAEMRPELVEIEKLLDGDVNGLMNKALREVGYPIQTQHSALSISEIRTRLARESIILLRNHNNVLPLNKNDKMSLAVMGPMADEALPGWPGAKGSSLLEAIRGKVAQGVAVRYLKGSDLFVDSPESNALIAAAVPASRQVDMTILCLGAADIAAISNAGGRLPVPQEKLLRAIYQATPNVIVVVVAPRTVSLNWASTRVSGIVASWGPGEEGAIALADVLFGDYNPSGRMPCEVPRIPDLVPSVYNADPVFQAYTPQGPLYPLGFGLSYTRFGYSNIRYAKGSSGGTLSVHVTNEGDRAGDEVVQLYLDNGESKKLLDYMRVNLSPKKSEVVTFKVSVPAKSRVLVGAASNDIRLQCLIP